MLFYGFIGGLFDSMKFHQWLHHVDDVLGIIYHGVSGKFRVMRIPLRKRNVDLLVFNIDNLHSLPASAQFYLIFFHALSILGIQRYAAKMPVYVWCPKV